MMNGAKLNLSAWTEHRSSALSGYGGYLVRSIKAYEDRIEELEAKLAQATEALEAIARPKTGPDADWTKPEIYKWRAGWYLRYEERARTTLAELKEDK